MNLYLPLALGSHYELRIVMSFDKIYKETEGKNALWSHCAIRLSEIPNIETNGCVKK